MTWTFGPDDDKAFQQAKRDLLARFRDWRTTTDDDVGEADVALDWKWGYDDGDLVTWTTDHLAEFLLSWYPRKVMVSSGDAPAIVASLRSFTTFLAEERLLGLRSSSIRALDQFLASSVGRLAAALTDTTKFGMAKSLVGGMAGLGFDPSAMTPESANAMMAAFNSLSFEERSRILGTDDVPPPWDTRWSSPWEALTAAIEMPPADPMDDASLAEAIGDVSIMRQVAVIRDFAAIERKLTPKGNLSVADARSLAEQLGLDQGVLHGEDSSRKQRVSSADDLPQTQFALRWAKAAGAVKVARSRMSATASWGKLKPRDAYLRTAAAILDKGPNQMRHAGNRWTAEALNRVIDEGIAPLLAVLWAVGEVDFEEMFGAVSEVVDHEIAWSAPVPDGSKRRRVRWAMEALFDNTAQAGLTRLEGQDVEVTKHGFENRSGGTLSLTPLARATLAPWLTARGFSVPEVGTLVDQPLVTVFEQIGEWHTERVMAEFAAWSDAHGAESTIEAVRAVLQPGCDPVWRVAAVDLVSTIDVRPGGPPNEAAVGRLLDTAGHAQATNWLVTNGSLDVSHDREAILLAGVELLAAQLDSDPRSDNELFVSFITMIDELRDLIESMWRMREPFVGDVLAAIGRLHPDAKTAKAARKALLRHRSHLANLR